MIKIKLHIFAFMRIYLFPLFALFLCASLFFSVPGNSVAAPVEKPVDQPADMPVKPRPVSNCQPQKQVKTLGNSQEKAQANAQDKSKDRSQNTSAIIVPEKKEEVESVCIGETLFPVPPPWAGNRVRVPKSTVENLMVIPPTLTLNGTEISLRQEAVAALAKMAEAAQKEDINLQVDSAYRGAAYQRAIYLKKMGEGQKFKHIARYTAPPGYSEHSLGTAVDFHPSQSGFERTKAYKWLKKHAKEYGFAETYFRGNPFGITWEPWHWKFALPETSKPLVPELKPDTLTKHAVDKKKEG